MGVDLRVPKIRFATLIEDIPSTAVSQFIVWLDEKVAEFKVNGAMALDSSAEAPRWIRDYSMSVMLSGMSSSQSDNNSEHLPHERTSSSRRKEFPPRPRPQFMRRSPIPSPPVVSKPNRTVSGADISISRAAGEVTPHRQKRARDDGDSALSVVRANSNDLELVEIKKERLDDLVERTPLQVTNIIERGDNVPIQSSRVRSTELVPVNSLSQDDSLYGSTTPIRSMKEEPLPDSESGDVVDELPSDSFNTRDSSLRQSRPVSDMLPILSSPHSSTPVISRITPGIDRTSLLASQQSALEMSVESGQADDSFNIMSQEAISLDDSDDNDDSIIKGDAPEDFMTRIMAFESQHTDAGESGDGSMEGVPGTSGVGQSDTLLTRNSNMIGSDSHRWMMERILERLLRSQKSSVLTDLKYDRVVRHLYNPTETKDANLRHWVKTRGFRIMDLPGRDVKDALVIPAKNHQIDGRPVYLQVIQSSKIYDLVFHLHAGEPKHRGYKKCMDFIRPHYSGVTRRYVQDFCKFCPTCQLKQPMPTPYYVINDKLYRPADYKALTYDTNNSEKQDVEESIPSHAPHISN